MLRVFALAIAGMVAVVAGADGAPSKKRAPSPAAVRTPPSQAVQEQDDEFRSCDVGVRDFVQGRKQATALPVSEVKVDGLRMTLNFVHPYGESGDTPPNLGFTRAELLEERRRSLNETKQKIRTLAEAAKTGNVWYVIAIRNDGADESDGRRSPISAQPNEARSSASAAVFASIENKCITVYEYKDIPLGKLSEEMRRLLGETGLEPPPANNASAGPPS